MLDSFSANIRRYCKFFRDEFYKYINETFDKIQNLSKTNYDLALFHFHKGNIRDAIFRFKLLQYFNVKNYKINYYLGRCYFHQNMYKKASEYFDKCEENVDYYLKICSGNLSDILEIPSELVTHNNMIELERELYDKKIFQYLIKILPSPIDKLLDISNGSEMMIPLLKNKFSSKFVCGVKKDEISNIYKAKTISSDKPIYDEVYSIKEFFAKKIIKFDAILALDFISYTISNIELLEKFKKYLLKSSILILSFATNNRVKKYTVKSNKFFYNYEYVISLIKSQKWKIISEKVGHKKNDSTAIVVIKNV